jgi:hypothetical protein
MERSQILTTFGREKRCAGHQFTCNNLCNEYEIGDTFLIRNWEQCVYGIAELIGIRGTVFDLRIIRVW